MLLPGVFSVTRHAGMVECVHVGRLKLATNTAVYFYRIGDTLIDTGPPNQARKALAYVQKAPAPLRQILVTHHHEDHAGNAHLIAALHPTLSTRILAPVGSHEPLQRGFSMEWYRRTVWGAPSSTSTLGLLHALPTSSVARADDGSVVRLDAYAAPGHCEDHTVIHAPDHGWLFAADLFVTPRPKVARFDENLLDGLATLERIAALPFDTLMCAHRGVVRDGAAHLRTRAAWLRELRERAQALRSAGQPLQRIVASLLGREDALYYISAGDFSRANLIAGLLSDDLSVAAERTTRPDVKAMR